MANGPGRGFLTGALLVVFILLTLSAWRFMTSEESLESFEGFTAGPTRAADCQCLPGYIPSNVTNSKYGGKFIWYSGGVYFVRDTTKIRNWVPRCSMCGINICDWNVMNKVTAVEFNSLTPGQTFSCDILKQAQANNKNTTHYFCQSLNNPTETRKCY